MECLTINETLISQPQGSGIFMNKRPERKEVELLNKYKKTGLCGHNRAVSHITPCHCDCMHKTLCKIQPDKILPLAEKLWKFDS